MSDYDTYHSIEMAMARGVVEMTRALTLLLQARDTPEMASESALLYERATDLLSKIEDDKIEDDSPPAVSGYMWQSGQWWPTDLTEGG